MRLPRAQATARHFARAAVLATAAAGVLAPAVVARASLVSARTYYVSATGSDAADGLTPQTPWRSVAPARTVTFAPGDKLLLAGGSRFAGSIVLDAPDAGDAARPVVVGSYGVGRAVLAPVGTAGVVVHNTAGVVIRDLVVVGASAAERSQDGITVYNDLPGDRRLTGVTVTNVDVSGFKTGVAVGGGRGASGFRSVRVAASRLHHNVEAGLITYGPAFNAARPTYAHESVVVSGVEAYNNAGDAANLVRNTGSGIILGSVTGGRVDTSSAHDNGALCRAPEGPAGIWTYDSTRVVLERNVSFRNRTARADGDGLDLDQNVSYSTMQYNRTYDNDGAGYLVYTAQPNAAHAHNVVRYNTSTNDSRRSSWYGALTVAGRVSDLRVYGNTLSVTATGAYRPPVVRIGSGTPAFSLAGNSLTSRYGGPLVIRDR